MSTTNPARRVPLQALAFAPLLTAALIVGTGGHAPETSSGSPQAGYAAGTLAAPAALGTTTSGGASQQPVTINAKPVAFVSGAAMRAQRGRVAVKIAAAQKGKPYRYGGAGPRSFDCSGLIYYVYKKRLNVGLPRMANAQRKKTVRVGKAHVQPGDLIFFMSGGRAYHVGIYAGKGKVWHSPMPGQRVKLVKLWTSKWQAGRVR